MDQSLKESEPFLPCGWNVFVRAAVQMETLLKPLVWVGGWRWQGGGFGGRRGVQGSIHTVSLNSSSQPFALADDSTDKPVACCLLDRQ